MKDFDVPKNFALDMFLSNILSDYGKFDYLDIDTEKKSIVLDFLPIGESESISINLSKYELIQESGKYYFVIKNISCSKLWIDKVLKNILIDKKLEIPESYSMDVIFLL